MSMHCLSSFLIDEVSLALAYTLGPRVLHRPPHVVAFHALYEPVLALLFAFRTALLSASLKAAGARAFLAWPVPVLSSGPLSPAITTCAGSPLFGS